MSTVGLQDILCEVNKLSKSDVLSQLRQYADAETINMLMRKEKEEKINIFGILAVIRWILRRYSPEKLTMFYSDFDAFAIEIPLDFNSWKRIAREVKQEMSRCGLQDLCSKVAIFSKKAFEEDTLRKEYRLSFEKGLLKYSDLLDEL